MSKQINFEDAERKVFRIANNDGLWDIFLGCFFLIFAIAPLLSTKLGDFWSSATLFPILWIVYLIILLIRKYVITPRIGVVEFGQARKTKLKKFTVALLLVNVIAVILGFMVAVNFQRITGQIITVILGLIFLIGFNIAAYFLDFRRLYIYGLLAAISPLVGEWLFINGKATHHGIPITFGITASIMIIIGLIIFLRLLKNHPVLKEGILAGKK